MSALHLGDRVLSTLVPDRFGTVRNLYRFPNLTEKDWADVEWDFSFLPGQISRVYAS